MPLAAEGRAVGVMLPNANGAVVTILGLMTAGRVPAMINFTAGAANILAACRAAQIDTILSSRVFVEKAKLDQPGRGRSRRTVKIVYLEDVRASITLGDKLRGLLKANRPLVDAQARRLGRDPVHLGLGRRAEGRGAVPPQHAGQCRAGGGAHRLRPRGQGLQRAAGVPLVRPDRRAWCCRSSPACASISIPRRCTTGPCRS